MLAFGVAAPGQGCCNMLWLGLITVSPGDMSALSCVMGYALKYLFISSKVTPSEPSPCSAFVMPT